MRAGRLTRDELELAAWARHPAACHALGGAPVGPSPDELSRWVVGLGRWGRPVCMQVALRALEEVLWRCSAKDPAGRVEQQLAQLRGWFEKLDALPDEERAALRRLAAAPLQAGPGWRDQLQVAVVHVARSALEADFAPPAADAVVRCEAILGKGECRDPLVARVVVTALRR